MPDCDSCGRSEPTEPVHRVYVTPERWDEPGSTTTMTEIERWCWVCRAHYPHEPI